MLWKRRRPLTTWNRRHWSFYLRFLPHPTDVETDLENEDVTVQTPSERVIVAMHALTQILDFEEMCSISNIPILYEHMGSDTGSYHVKAIRNIHVWDWNCYYVYKGVWVWWGTWIYMCVCVAEELSTCPVIRILEG